MPKNYRGIVLLEIAYKIVTNILNASLLMIEESLDHKSQYGFRPGIDVRTPFLRSKWL